MAIQMREDLLIRDLSVDGLIVGIHQNRRLSKHVAAGSARIHLLDGVTDRAGHAIVIEVAVDPRSLVQRSRNQRNWVVASFAMPRVLDALGIPQHVYVLHVPGSPEGIGVCALPPLIRSALMAAGAV